MDEKPIIALTELAGNPPTRLTSVQEWLLPYEPFIETFWWFVFFSTLAFIIVRFLVIPIARRSRFGR